MKLALISLLLILFVQCSYGCEYPAVSYYNFTRESPNKIDPIPMLNNLKEMALGFLIGIQTAPQVPSLFDCV